MWLRGKELLAFAHEHSISIVSLIFCAARFLTVFPMQTGYQTISWSFTCYYFSLCLTHLSYPLGWSISRLRPVCCLSGPRWYPCWPNRFLAVVKNQVCHITSFTKLDLLSWAVATCLCEELRVQWPNTVDPYPSLFIGWYDIYKYLRTWTPLMYFHL
jgi:hypothetical protein